MPTDILSRQDEVMQGLRYIHGKGANYLPKSLVQRYSVCNVPPKIDISANPELKQDAHDRMHSMDIVYPHKLVEENVGSNRGLLIILKQEFYDKNNMGSGECQDYVNLNLDENIFWRTLMVLTQRLPTTNMYTCIHRWRRSTHVMLVLCDDRLSTTRQMLGSTCGCIPVCPWPGGTATSGLQKHSSVCSGLTSWLQCSITCTQAVSTVVNCPPTPHSHNTCRI